MIKQPIQDNDPNSGSLPLQSMTAEFTSIHRLKLIRQYMFALALAWTLGICVSLGWNLYQQKQTVQEHARLLALASFQKDVLYRRWNAGHGGVYVPVTDVTQPNPYLAGNPARDLQGSDGKQYTLINPAYMTRQVFELQRADMGVLGHITSLNPIRPQNQADAWETHALQTFEQGIKEFSSVEVVDGQPMLRFMRPLYVEEGCLKCHSQQGYKVGEVRGGISETVPINPLRAASQGFNLSITIGHGLIWLVGLFGIGFAAWRLQKGVQLQVQTEQKLLHLSTHDALTGLYNRTFFEDTLQRIEDLQVMPISVVAVDMDELKKVNDTLGHDAGDRLIQVTGDILHRSFRAHDTVARIGGDEFVVFLPGTDSVQAAAALKRVRTHIEQYNSQQPVTELSLSIGVATSQAGARISETLKIADSRMYAEKEAKKRQAPRTDAA